jgi:hypothetical protein
VCSDIHFHYFGPYLALGEKQLGEPCGAPIKTVYCETFLTHPMARADHGGVGPRTAQHWNEGQRHTAVVATDMLLLAAGSILHQSHMRHVHHGRPVNRLALKGHLLGDGDGGLGETFVRSVEQRLRVPSSTVQQSA